MKQLPIIIASLILIACVACSSCATQAGQLTASEIAPLVFDVCDDLEDYVALGITPEVNDDGTTTSRPMTDGERFRVLGGVVALRNAIHAAVEEPLEPFPGDEPSEPVPELDSAVAPK